MDRYAGEWVMLVGSKVVAHDKSLSGTILQTSRMTLKSKPAVFLVPRKDEGPYLLFALPGDLRGKEQDTGTSSSSAKVGPLVNQGRKR